MNNVKKERTSNGWRQTWAIIAAVALSGLGLFAQNSRAVGALERRMDLHASSATHPGGLTRDAVRDIQRQLDEIKLEIRELRKR